MKTLVCIAVAALLSHGAMQRVVLCLESDGDFEIEMAANGCCSAAADPTERQTSLVSTSAAAVASSSSCGPCTDTEVLSIRFVRWKVHPGSADATGLVSMVLPAAFLPHSNPSGVTASSTSPPIDSSILSQKKTILLI